MSTLAGILFGLGAWFVVRYVLGGFYSVNQNERAVKTSFGRAQRQPGERSTLDDPTIAEALRPDERERYVYPQVRVMGPGGPYLKMPWERVYKVSVATQTLNMALDLEDPQANARGTILEAVTKDQLNTGLTGQIRYRVSESNLYAYLFGVKKPVVHIMGYFISVLRERIANFEAKPITVAAVVASTTAGTRAVDAGGDAKRDEVTGVSINDLRKNLRDLNEFMDRRMPRPRWRVTAWCWTPR